MAQAKYVRPLYDDDSEMLDVMIARKISRLENIQADEAECTAELEQLKFRQFKLATPTRAAADVESIKSKAKAKRIADNKRIAKDKA